MNVEKIKEQLPVGAYTAISKISEINTTTIQRFFKGKKIKPELELKIIEATTELLRSTKEAKKTAVSKLEKVCNM